MILLYLYKILCIYQVYKYESAIFLLFLRALVHFISYVIFPHNI